MPLQILTPEILSNVEQFHEGLHYYIARNIGNVYDARRLLKSLGLTPHDSVKVPCITRRSYYTGKIERIHYGAYDFILAGTENDPMPCNIAHFNEDMRSLQFFVNKEAGTFGRLHGSAGYDWQMVA
jgi:hypothetical protein